MTLATAADLRKVPLFEALDDTELGAIAPRFTVRAYPKNAILLTEGEPVDVVFFILCGRARNFWRDASGQEMDLVILGPGESFGYASLVGVPMLISSIAVDPLVVVTIDRAAFEAVLLGHPPLALRFLQEVIGVVCAQVQRAKVFSMEGVHGRVAWLLQRRARLGEGGRVTERLTHADIARRVGATREMVGQVLRELARGGYIAASGGRFTILKELPRRP
jgi:CRP/FNR family cyclic AMP-dependent transcriptional regulator